jgi:hypothetical protein
VIEATPVGEVEETVAEIGVPPSTVKVALPVIGAIGLVDDMVADNVVFIVPGAVPAEPSVDESAVLVACGVTTEKVRLAVLPS